MYAKTSNSTPDTIKVQSDKGSLRLQFSTRYNPIFGGKRKYQPLGMKDTAENRQKAEAIAHRIESDLQHPDWEQLFDPTFAKYGIKSQYAALQLAAPIPESEPEMTVGEMWEDYLVWKRPQLEETTYRSSYEAAYSNLIKGLVWSKKTKTFTDAGDGLLDTRLGTLDIEKWFNESTRTQAIKQKTLAALSEAFARLQSLGKTKLAANPFILSNKNENKTDKYKPKVDADGIEREWWDVPDNESDNDERDRRSFSKADMLTIIDAFYSHKNAALRQVAPLVEFRFLTGCRSGEAFALRWRDCFRGTNQNNIVFSRSYDGHFRVTKNTKNGDIRIFKMYPKLRELLLKIKTENAQPNDLVFSKLNGKTWDSPTIQKIWDGRIEVRGETEYNYPGVVTQLADDGLIEGYLPFYNCRHTFISLQAHAGTDLFLLATACGNSVETIQKHYLGVNPDVSFADI
ncbi:DUF3596 domain-containing protein [Microcoleus sp. BR0-C5]|uniref:Arm DNA-binding domain-containing protein n=1 Tax=Microcoleus sp. BR0-C5 TaxID=2818713 RepID=UPI002FD6F166